MLDSVVEDFRKIYENCAAKFEGFVPRDSQKRMSFEIAKVLTSPDSNGISVLEAGTGVGKSFGYMSAVIPIAKKQKKKVIISTATIALQEQLVNKDLPLFQSVSPVPFTFKLAKGRANYVCHQALMDVIGDGVSAGGLPYKAPAQDYETIKEMIEALDSNKWNGERDTWKASVTDRLWAVIKSDSHKCKKKHEGHKDCPFPKAREDLMSFDVIVANHALVLSDLSLAQGGGLILPDASDSIYVFDEGHHLPDIARESVSGQFAIKGTLDLNESLRKTMFRYNKRFDNDVQFTAMVQHCNTLIDLMAEVDSEVSSLHSYFQSNQTRMFKPEVPYGASKADNTYERFEPYRFVEVTPFEKDLFDAMKKACGKVRSKLREINKEAAKILEHGLSTNLKKELEQVGSDMEFYSQRYEAVTYVTDLILNEDPSEVIARWAELDPTRGVIVQASPVESSKVLNKLLWTANDRDDVEDKRVKVVITSATLSALGKFSLYGLESGVPPESLQRTLPSPFDYPNVATLYLPPVQVDPRQEADFTKYLGEQMFFDCIEGQLSTLVLFSSYNQMRKVRDLMTPIVEKHGYSLQCQKDVPKELMLKTHKDLVGEGKPSIIMGTSSLSEGLDLARDLLVNVIITKIPFATPTDPVSLTYSEHLERNGGRAFFDITLPSASRQLIQGVGRLIRTEDDEGRVIILDKRMTTMQYGEQLRRCLPAFKLERNFPPKTQ